VENAVNTNTAKRIANEDMTANKTVTEANREAAEETKKVKEAKVVTLIKTDRVSTVRESGIHS
jgi:hypothetical protein